MSTACNYKFFDGFKIDKIDTDLNEHGKRFCI